MNWIVDHLQLVIALAGGIAYWLKQRSEAKATGEEPARPVQPATVAEADDAERARRIREEILRKIAERRGGAGAATREEKAGREQETVLQRPPLMRPVAPLDPFGGPGRPAVQRRDSAEVVPPALVKTETDQAVLARQERLAQQMRDLDAQRATALRRATATTEAAQVAEGVRARAASNVRQDLREPRTLRHAMILREVLGPPVSLR